jgi:hypothetical protein
MTKEQVVNESTKFLLDAFSYNLKREQFGFIDKGVDKKPHSSMKEKKMYAESIKEIKAFTLRQKPFFCEDIKKVLKENDELMRQINEN